MRTLTGPVAGTGVPYENEKIQLCTVKGTHISTVLRQPRSPIFDPRISNPLQGPSRLPDQWSL